MAISLSEGVASDWEDGFSGRAQTDIVSQANKRQSEDPRVLSDTPWSYFPNVISVPWLPYKPVSANDLKVLMRRTRPDDPEKMGTG